MVKILGDCKSVYIAYYRPYRNTRFMDVWEAIYTGGMTIVASQFILNFFQLYSCFIWLRTSLSTVQYQFHEISLYNEKFSGIKCTVANFIGKHSVLLHSLFLYSCLSESIYSVHLEIKKYYILPSNSWLSYHIEKSLILI